MIIKLRGKIWKQITFEEYRKLEGYNVAIFKDLYWDEQTYFKLIEKDAEADEYKIKNWDDIDINKIEWIITSEGKFYNPKFKKVDLCEPKEDKDGEN